MSLGRGRVLLLVALAAAAVYANTLGLGFALDDDPVIRLNPVVTEGRVVDALTGPYWRLEPEEGLLYRPLLLASFAVEWELWDGEPGGFHAVNVAVHVLVTVLVTALLLLLLAPGREAVRTGGSGRGSPGRWAALAGGLVFAVHPVHVEAVANVVGRAELYAASAVLAACLLLLWRPGSGGGRGVRLVAIVGAYAVGLGSKEIAVTLPVLLALLAVHPAIRSAGGSTPGPDADRSPVRKAAGRLGDDLPLFAALAAVLGAYLVVRLHVLGSLTGEELPAELVGTTAGERVWAALSLWPEYLRLLLFPADLVADYGPGVLELPRGPAPASVGGALILVGLGGLGVLSARSLPLVSLGVLWFFVTILPVAHLGVHAGVLLAERTLYLPSAGLALAVGGLVSAWQARGWSRRVRPRTALALGAVVVVALATRTVTRNPVWDSSFTLLRDLGAAHPESHRALRLYGDLLMREGDTTAAVEAFGRAAELHPHRYPVLVEAGAAYREAGRLDRAAELFGRAVQVAPHRRQPYRLLAEVQLNAGEGRRAHRTVVQGLARAGADRELRSLLSEAYLSRGDLEGALRARRAALALDPGSRADWSRLAEILELAGDSVAADRARSRATALPEDGDGGGAGDGGGR